MGRSNRDNFSKEVLNKLYKRVNGHCSNPGCCASTTGPETTTGDGVINIGVGCHITAAAPGGPRFDGSLSKKERTSIKNAIWLCQNCAKLVDADDSNISVEKLLDWRQRAESDARRKIGQSPISLLLAKSNQLSSAIRSAFVAEKNRLEALDDRVGFQLEHNGENLIYKISAKKPFSFDVNLRANPDALDKLKLHYEEGEAVRIRADEFRFTGSSALEELMKDGQSGDLVLGSREFECRYLFHGTTKAGKEFEYIFNGIIRGGTKKIKCFISPSGDSPIRAQYEFYRNGNELVTDVVDFNINFKAWEGSPLSSLESFEAVKNMFGEPAPEVLRINHSIQGHPIFGGVLTRDLLGNASLRVSEALTLIDKCVKIAAYYNVNPIFTGLSGMSADQIDKIEMVYELITSGSIEVDGSNTLATTELAITADNLDSLINASKSTGKDTDILAFVEDKSSIDLFGIPINLDSISFSMTRPRISSNIDFTKVRIGDKLPIEWSGSEGSRTTIKFANNRELP